MELRDYFRTLQKSFNFIVSFTVIFVLIVLAVVYFGKTLYETNITLTVDRPQVIDQKSASYYLYDDYYSLQASGLLADTVMNLMQSPGVVQAIYTRAGVALPQVRNVSQLAKIFTVRKLPPATVSITLKSADSEQSKALLVAANEELQSRTTELNAQKSSDQIVLHSTAPVSTKVIPFWALDLVIAACIGLLISVFAALLRDYLRDTRT